MLCFEVSDGFDVLGQVHVASAKVPVRPDLPRPIAHLLCNCQVLRVVLDGLAEVPLRPTRVRTCGKTETPHILWRERILCRESTFYNALDVMANTC
jgi:hypothetical protein